MRFHIQHSLQNEEGKKETLQNREEERRWMVQLIRKRERKKIRECFSLEKRATATIFIDKII